MKANERELRITGNFRRMTKGDNNPRGVYIVDPDTFENDYYDLKLERLPTPAEKVFTTIDDPESFSYGIVYMLEKNRSCTSRETVQEMYGILKESVGDSTIYHLATLTRRP